MNGQKKKEQILNAMQELMNETSADSISVSDIARKAGIGKGSIYYYFPSKNDIIEAVIERSYFRILDEGRELAQAEGIDVFKKLEIIYRACLNSSLELKRQEASSSFLLQQQNAFIHQKFYQILITKMEPILADIMRQGIQEGKIRCRYPEETARIILMVLTVTLDNTVAPVEDEQLARILKAFSAMQTDAMDMPEHALDFLKWESDRTLPMDEAAAPGESTEGKSDN